MPKISFSVGAEANHRKALKQLNIGICLSFFSQLQRSEDALKINNSLYRPNFSYFCGKYLLGIFDNIQRVEDRKRNTFNNPTVKSQGLSREFLRAAYKRFAISHESQRMTHK